MPIASIANGAIDDAKTTLARMPSDLEISSPQCFAKSPSAISSIISAARNKKRQAAASLAALLSSPLIAE